MVNHRVGDNTHSLIPGSFAKAVEVVAIAKRPFHPGKVYRLIATPPAVTGVAFLGWGDQNMGHAQFLQARKLFFYLVERLVEELCYEHDPT